MFNSLRNSCCQRAWLRWEHQTIWSLSLIWLHREHHCFVGDCLWRFLFVGRMSWTSFMNWVFVWQFATEAEPCASPLIESEIYSVQLFLYFTHAGGDSYGMKRCNVMNCHGVLRKAESSSYVSWQKCQCIRQSTIYSDHAVVSLQGPRLLLLWYCWTSWHATIHRTIYVRGASGCCTSWVLDSLIWAPSCAPHNNF